MSSNLAYATPLRRPREEANAPQPRVRIVTTRAQRRSRPKLVYALVATVVIFAIFLVQLLITISLSSGAYQIDGLQSTQQNLGRTESSLSEKIDTLDSSQNLQANAIALGMVASSRAAFLRLSDGAVLGSAAPARAVKITSLMTNAASGSVSNSLLTDIPVITPSDTLTSSTGTGHGDANAPVTGSGTTESTQGTTAPADTGSTSQYSPNSSSSTPDGDLPSPVTH
ncbi:MAG TPA: hypothetical protein VHZ81_14915 [Galbitalea sp.]|jgi:hypothetical protein|nr:hypothetical protein [Galbitalea sp.]